ncbi:PadR family transcriptional regulator [Geodermatophilus sp. SYSU D00965]
MRPMRDHDGRHPGLRHHHPRHGAFGPPDGPPRPHRRGGRGRAPRGDVRTAVLLLLAQEPMHGYQLMQAIAERSGGRWSPSPGAIYPTIAQLEDEGLVTVTAEAGRKLVTLTDAGREHLESRQQTWPDPFAGRGEAGPGDDLPGLVHQLHGAVREVARTGTDAQRAAAARVLADARRSIYLLLAEGPETPGEPETPGS